MISNVCLYPDCNSIRRQLYLTCELHRDDEDKIRRFAGVAGTILGIDKAARANVLRGFAKEKRETTDGKK